MSSAATEFKCARFPDGPVFAGFPLMVTKVPNGLRKFYLMNGGIKRALFKSCSVCSENWFVGDFYGKGNRTDSACKECQKKKKRAKYVVAKSQDVVAGLINIINLSTNGLINMIHAETDRLDEVITCLKKSEQ